MMARITRRRWISTARSKPSVASVAAAIQSSGISAPNAVSSIAEEPGARPGVIILNAGTFDDPSVVKNRSHHARVLPQEGWPAIFFSDNADDVTVVIDHRYCADFVVEQCVPNSKKKTS